MTCGRFVAATAHPLFEVHPYHQLTVVQCDCPNAQSQEANADKIIGFADEIQDYVISEGEQNFYADRKTRLIAEALLHRIGEAVSACRRS